MASKATLENALRNEILQVIIKALVDHFDAETIAVGSGEISIPVTDAEGNEKYPKIKVPRGTRNGEGGYDPYDGYAAGEAFQLEKESKAQERAVKKAMKEAEKGKKKEE